jgi:prepilin-type N-terminal cleavage/methylation domain-containing protein
MNRFEAVKKSESRGFTLIELLIVVAIIAILAAIAVPNFLEAQTRSKVARCKADMRTITTAVEAYQVDWNRVPPGYHEGAKWNPKWWGFTGQDKWWAIYGRMTTPVAYMTSIPTDVFTPKGYVGQRNQPGGQNNPFMYQSIYAKTGQGNDMSALCQAASETGVYFCLYSRGPSRRQSPEPGITTDPFGAAAKLPGTATELAWPNLIYDPTNGTMSFGWLMRSSKEQL